MPTIKLNPEDVAKRQLSLPGIIKKERGGRIKCKR